MERTTIVHKLLLVAFGLCIGLLLLEILLAVVPGGIDSLSDPVSHAKIRVMVLGESTSSNLLDGNGSWPDELQKLLDARFGPGNVAVINKAIPGTDSIRIQNELEQNLEIYGPDIVLTMIGINDDPKALDVEHSKRSTVLRLPRLFKYLFQLVKNGWNEIGLRIRLSLAWTDGQKSDLLTGLGSHYFDIRRYALSEDHLREAIKYREDNVEAHSILTEIYLYESRIDDLELLFLDALENVGERDWIYLGLGRAMISQGNHNDCETYLLKARKLNPESPPINFWLGKLMLAKGKHHDAEYFFNQALDDIHGKASFKELAKLSFGANRTDEALAYLRRSDPLGEDGELDYIKRRIGEMVKEEGTLGVQNKVPLGLIDRKKLIFSAIRQLVNSSGASLIIMQYPNLDVEDARSLWQDDSLIYISNENFTEGGETSVWFTDNFGEKFGHTTKRGNEKLAANAFEAMQHIIDDMLK